MAGADLEHDARAVFAQQLYVLALQHRLAALDDGCGAFCGNEYLCPYEL